MSNLIPLNELQPGDRARICAIQADPMIRQRLQEMGLTRGESLVVEKLAPLGDPMALRVRNYRLSLRREEGACILVEKEG